MTEEKLKAGDRVIWIPYNVIGTVNEIGLKSEIITCYGLTYADCYILSFRYDDGSITSWHNEKFFKKI